MAFEFHETLKDVCRIKRHLCEWHTFMHVIISQKHFKEYLPSGLGDGFDFQEHISSNQTIISVCAAGLGQALLTPYIVHM